MNPLSQKFLIQNLSFAQSQFFTPRLISFFMPSMTSRESVSQSIYQRYLNHNAKKIKSSAWQPVSIEFYARRQRPHILSFLERIIGKEGLYHLFIEPQTTQTEALLPSFSTHHDCHFSLHFFQDQSILMALSKDEVADILNTKASLLPFMTSTQPSPFTQLHLNVFKYTYSFNNYLQDIFLNTMVQRPSSEILYVAFSNLDNFQQFLEIYFGGEDVSNYNLSSPLKTSGLFSFQANFNSTFDFHHLQHLINTKIHKKNENHFSISANDLQNRWDSIEEKIAQQKALQEKEILENQFAPFDKELPEKVKDRLRL